MEWISVKDKSPMIGATVLTHSLTFNSEQNPYRLCYFINGKFYDEVKGHEAGECLDITHWMPLPEPPKNQENNDSINNLCPVCENKKYVEIEQNGYMIKEYCPRCRREEMKNYKMNIDAK